MDLSSGELDVGSRVGRFLILQRLGKGDDRDTAFAASFDTTYDALLEQLLIYLQKGRLADSNAEQVAKIVRILSELSREVASPAETRELLDLKGLDKVGY